MRNKISILLIAAVLFTALPLLGGKFALADTVSDLRIQLQTVLNRIVELEAELKFVESSANTSVGSTCLALSRNLGKGMDNADVKKLQIFLAQDSSIYPEGITSGYFGRLTELAVQRWQAKNGVASYGTAATTGYGAVGPKTRRAIEAACIKGGGGTTVAGANNIISFTFSNTSGQAPFNASTNISMLEGACMSYKIDWGDGTAPYVHIANQTSNCGSGITNTTAQHTYSLSGEYTALLYAGKGNMDSLPQVTLANLTVLVGQPYVRVISPNGGEDLKLGDNTTIKWQVANQPDDSAVVFYIVGPTGTYRFAKRSHRSQEFNWIVGDRVCDGNGCNVQLPLGSNYMVRAVLYTPADACIDFCNDDSTRPQFLVNDESDASFSLSQLGASGGNPLEVAQSSGKAPFTPAMTVNIAPVSSGVGNFEIDFGDGSTPFRIHIPAGENRVTTRTVSHTYPNTGDYYVRLRPVGAVQHIAESRINVTDPTFSVSPASLANAPVTVEARFYTDSACSHSGDMARSYTVDWGDNTETSRYELLTNKCTTTTAGSQTLTLKTFTHAYTTAGTYRPELTIAIDNMYNKQVVNVEVGTTSFNLSPTFGFAPLSSKATFATDESCVMGNATDVTYTIDWGDGSANTVHNKSLASCGGTFALNMVDREFSHIYQDIGRYTVTLTVRKGDIGASYSRSKEVVVDKSVLRNGWRKLAHNIDNLKIGENMAAAISALFSK